MRAEEASAEAWFALPEETDEDTDWSKFQVTIEGPVSVLRRGRCWRVCRAVIESGQTLRLQLSVYRIPHPCAGKLYNEPSAC
jgi:hypothetical protein